MYRHLIFSILIFLFHKSHGQDLYENLEIEIKKMSTGMRVFLLKATKCL